MVTKLYRKRLPDVSKTFVYPILPESRVKKAGEKQQMSLKIAKTFEWYHREATDFARIAVEAKEKGDAGRSVLLYEWALDRELRAMNMLLAADSADTAILLPLYLNAARWALGCARNDKARRLIEEALLLQSSEEQRTELEGLLVQAGTKK